MSEKVKEGALLARVRELLGSTTIPSLEIYKETGVAPNQQWAIRTGKTKNPSVNAIERLYDYLNGWTLGDAVDSQADRMHARADAIIAEANKA